jgi:hypothetical protein
MLAWVVIIRQHLPRASRGPRQSRKSGAIRALPLPALLFNISTFKSKRHLCCGAKIPTLSGRSTVFPSYPLSFQTITHSFALTENSTLFFSIVSALFAKNHRGGGCLWLTSSLLGSTFQRSNRRSRSARDVPTFKLFNVFSLPRFSPSGRPVAFPQHGTSRPLCRAPVPCTIKVHAGAKCASRAWPPRFGHGLMGAETGRPRLRRSRR